MLQMKMHHLAIQGSRIGEDYRTNGSFLAPIPKFLLFGTGLPQAV